MSNPYCSRTSCTHTPPYVQLPLGTSDDSSESEIWHTAREYTQKDSQNPHARESTNLNLSNAFGKKGQSVSTQPGHYRIERRHTSLRILPQREQESWSRYIYRKFEKVSEFWRQLVKTRGGATSNVKSAMQNLKEHKKSREHDSTKGSHS